MDDVSRYAEEIEARMDVGDGAGTATAVLENRPRCIFLSHAKAIEAFDRFVEWRYRRGTGVSLDRREYRGIMPRTRLILTQKGGPFELSVKRRVNFEGEGVEYLAADSLQTYVTSLYRVAGLGEDYS
jgi:integrase/recombinase XerD